MINQWQKLAEDVVGSGSSDIGFIKEAKTVLKIVAPKGAKENYDTSWFREFKQYFGDKPSKKFMVYAVDVMADTKEVKPWVINASSFTQIINLIADNDYDVLTPDSGTPISIKKSGSGMNTTYTVQAAPKAFDSSVFTVDDISLDKAIEQLTKPKDKAPATSDEIDW